MDLQQYIFDLGCELNSINICKHWREQDGYEVCKDNYKRCHCAGSIAQCTNERANNE